MRNKRIFDYFRKKQPPLRRCDHPDCGGDGLFRAPKSRSQLYDYFWFCLDHVRDYNKNWDYYAGMSTADIEATIRQDTVWEKPSWPLGGGSYTKTHTHFRFFDATEDTSHPQAGHKPYGDPRPSHIIAQERHALHQLQLEYPASFAEIKAQYKKLAKEHHPDLNQSNPAAEERLKEINRAYQFLKTHALDAVKQP